MTTATKDEIKKMPLIVQFCIPTIGSEIELVEDFEFMAYNDYTNSAMLEKLDIMPKRSAWKVREKMTPAESALEDKIISDFYKKYPYNSAVQKITIPKGSVIKVTKMDLTERQYRYKSEPYLIFKVMKHANLPKVKFRFSVKISEVNNIIGHPIDIQDSLRTKVFKPLDPKNYFVLKPQTVK